MKAPYHDAMSFLRQATTALQRLETELLNQDGAEPTNAQALAAQIRQVRLLLDHDGAAWIGTTEAKRLLGIRSENTIKAWARLGRLRSRSLPNGRTQVLLDDVLHRRRWQNGLADPLDGYTRRRASA